MADAVHAAGAQRTADEMPLHSLVVVGSSAGGIEALSTLVATLPADFPAPVVLAQHLDPRYPSHLGEILARRSTLPVWTVTDHEPLAPGVVYVVPADRHVEITDHEVRLRADSRNRPKPSIDRLLTSAAVAYGERLIAVILTGTGSDGASGPRGEGCERNGRHREPGDRRFPGYAGVVGSLHGRCGGRSGADRTAVARSLDGRSRVCAS